MNVEFFRPIDFNSVKLCTDKFKLVIIGRENLNSGRGILKAKGS